ncbi:hypothetical protein [Geodermatophilus sp. CPCC 206100]|uniref:hypothetical protein n=1 Tax=Geodermatophilus sp. CPCC 206100 TaxID=3020054 RepID=UPI003B00B140
MVENDEVPHAAQQASGTDVFRVQTTRPDGTEETVEVIKTHGGYLTRADRPAGATGTPNSTSADPVALVQAALVVDAVNSVRITPAVWGPAPSELLAALRIDPSALDGEQGDDRFDIMVEGLEERIVAVPCWVGDSHVAGLVHEGRVVPVFLDDGEALAGDELAGYTWSSESGGAPISWNGGAELRRLNGPLGLDHRWGDIETGSSLVELPADSAALAQLIGDWLSGEDGTSLLGAAFAYEPFDPGGSLSAEDREEWQHLLNAVDVTVILALDAGTQLLVRQVLERQDDYAALTDALAHPTGRDGQKLQRALEKFADHGRVLEDVLNWRTD